MEKLQETYHKNGTDYTLEKRNDKAAMYKHFQDGLHIGYEVFLVKVQPEFKFPNGTVNPEKEAFPGNEMFGKTAWAFTSLELSNKRYDEITNGVLRPERPKIEKPIVPKGKKRKRGRPRKYPKTNKTVVKKAKRKFVYEGKEYNSKSEVARILLGNGENKHNIAKKLGVTVQTIHAVQTKMKKN